MSRAGRLTRSAVFLAALPGLAALAWWWPHVRNEFFVLLGSRNESGGWYGFHSGFGGAAYIGLPAVAAGFWWHHQCGVHRCYWYARRTTAAGERACWKHHPHPKRTAEDLHAAHHEAAGRQP
jgi:hypothetical protein